MFAAARCHLNSHFFPLYKASRALQGPRRLRSYSSTFTSFIFNLTAILNSPFNKYQEMQGILLICNWCIIIDSDNKAFAVLFLSEQGASTKMLNILQARCAGSVARRCGGLLLHVGFGPPPCDSFQRTHDKILYTYHYRSIIVIPASQGQR